MKAVVEMNDLTGRYFARGSKVYASSEFQYHIFKQGYSVYEVIRIMNGSGLFLEEHIDRLSESVRLSRLQFTIDRLSITETIAEVIAKCSISNGNIKLVYHFPEKGPPDSFVYYIPHFYPSQEDYINGVATSLVRSIRIDPNIKRLASQPPATKTGFAGTPVYEHLLVDDDEHVTEGSKSNVFFITGSNVFTAPDELVLKGITRQKIIDILKYLDYKLIKRTLSIHDLTHVETAFLTGTSPKVLPIQSINKKKFDVDHPVLRTIMKAYDKMVDEYFSGRISF